MDNDKIDSVVLEGGSLFYLTYFFSQFYKPYRHLQIKDYEAQQEIYEKSRKKAQKLLSDNYELSWQHKKNLLNQICPDFDPKSDEIGKNDLYRLELAFTQAIISEGTTYFKDQFTSKDSDPQDQEIPLNQYYSLYGIFLVSNRSNTYTRILKRCDQMI